MKIILVRHGQTEFNEKEVFRGHVDIPLDELGRKQARAAAEGIHSFNIQRIYSSPLQRALETAQIIGKKTGLQPRTDQDLIDLDYGVWQGLPLKKVQRDYPDLYKKWLQKPQKVRFPNGESLDIVRQRLGGFMRRILVNPPGHDMVIVSHRIILKILACIMLDLDNSFFWRIQQDLGAVSVFEYEQKVFNLVLLNDVCHLKGMYSRVAKDF